MEKSRKRTIPLSFDKSWPNGTTPPQFDQALADSYVGNYILVGITYFNHADVELRRQQLPGIIERAEPDGILISLRGVHDGESWKMPPLLAAISCADPGIYTLHTTGEKIEDPDHLATWRIHEPQTH